MQMREFCRGYIVAYNLTDDESTIKFRLDVKLKGTAVRERPLPEGIYLGGSIPVLFRTGTAARTANAVLRTESLPILIS